MARLTKLLPLAILLLVVAAPVVAGDRDVAKLLHKKAEKAARAKDYEAAADLYQRALEEHSPYPEAAYGLAVALEKLGRSQEALKAYLRCRDDVEGLSRPSRALKRLADKARRAIKKLGAGYDDLQDLDRRFVKKLLDIGRRCMQSRPAWAKKVFETALAIDPENAVAKSQLAKLGYVKGPAGAAKPFTPLATDDSLPNWDPGVRDPWTCSGGIIQGAPATDAGQLNWVRDRFAGTFSFRASFRVAQVTGAKPTFGFLFADKPNRDPWAFFVTWDNELVLVRYQGREHKEERTKILTGFDRSKWHRLRLEVSPGRVDGFLDGDRAFFLDGESQDAFDGALALFVQGGRIQIKDPGMRK